MNHGFPMVRVGQSYKVKKEGAGENNFIKLIPKGVSEKDGFEEFFNQECRALEQLEGRGIWQIQSLDLQNGSIGLFMIGLMETLLYC